MKENKLKEELYAANENRAIIYYLIFDELRNEIGEEKAIAIMKRAIYRRGEQIGEGFKGFSPDNFVGLRDAFLKGIPDNQKMFKPEVGKCDNEGLDLTFYNCPLKNAWQKMGLSKDEAAKICDIAGSIDYGTFAAAGFEFSMRALPQGEEHCCHLKVRPKV